MARLSEHHQKLDALGFGKCSVPMWGGGCPSGFCDDLAYGERPDCKTWRDAWTGEERRHDGKYNGYVPSLACPGHGGPKTRVFLDGNSWCAVCADFVNLQESDAGFGDTPEQARKALETPNVRVNPVAEGDPVSEANEG